MSNSFMSPLPTFTLESLVTNGQWMAAQNNTRKKEQVKVGDQKKGRRDETRLVKEAKPAL